MMKKIIYLWIFFFSFTIEARIREIRIKGNQLISKDAIRAQLKSRVNQRYQKSKVTQDVKTLFNLGYFDNIYVDLKKTSKGEILTYVVEEKSRVNSITYKGSQVLSEKKLEEFSELSEYEFLSIRKLKQGMKQITEALKEKGYFLAQVDYEVKPLDKGKIDLVISIYEGQKILIQGVSIIGNKNVKSDRIKKYLASKEKNFFSFLTSGAIYSEEKIKRDGQIIRYLYMEEGFLEMNLVDTTVTIAPDQSGLYISFTVSEGEKFQVGQVEFKGDLIFSKVELRQDQKLQTGETFVYSKLQEDLTRLRALYGDKGYAYVNVIPQFSTQAPDTIHVLFDIDKGDPVYVRQINISGNTHTRDKVIRRQIPLSEGELYNATDLLKSRASIQRLGFFEDVRFLNQPVMEKEDQIDLLVSVKEREKLGELSGGIAYMSSVGIIPNAKLMQENLLGYGTSAGVDLSGVISQGQVLFDAFYTDPYFLDSNWYFGAKVSAFNPGLWLDRMVQVNSEYLTGEDESQQRIVVPFDTLGVPDFIFSSDRSNYLRHISYRRFFSSHIGGKLSFGRIFQNKLKLLSHVGFEQIQFTHLIDPEIFDAVEAGGFRNILGGSLDYDNRDDRLFPKNGWVSSLNLEYTHQSRRDRSSLQWTQMDIWGSYYFDLHRVVSSFSNRWDWDYLRDIVIKNRIQYGRIRSLSENGIVPFDKLYLLGGPLNLRGFALNSVGTKRQSSRLQVRNEDSTLSPVYIPYGGTNQLFYNLELRFPLVKEADVYGVLFFDIGYASEDLLSQLTHLSFFRKSAGFGLFMATPLGPINVKWGFPFDVREEFGESNFEFQFNMGYDF